ncbi:hypothetical protein GCM10011487_57000 [Steroidobacter agaridevorans]|uniref:Uncharacterized protein n=1 Tax=Steroidobacter agaridevorans TaxID=2695856 RepID=A0A829YKC7_9GAMM|nr:hypothetical protein GCM10011487_57000 [Steroidobacter agaridevorans]
MPDQGDPVILKSTAMEIEWMLCIRKVLVDGGIVAGDDAVTGDIYFSPGMQGRQAWKQVRIGSSWVTHPHPHERPMISCWICSDPQDSGRTPFVRDMSTSALCVEPEAVIWANDFVVDDRP